MPMGTANSQIRKILLFECLKKLQEDVCYRCKNKIENIEELSIEHKKSWLFSDNPKESFFDLQNIAFSHLICNTRAAPKVDFKGAGWNKGKPSPHRKIGSGGTAWCSHHKDFIAVENFARDKHSWNGYKNLCNSCRSIYRKKRYQEGLSR